jgi:hypothetical protein
MTAGAEETSWGGVERLGRDAREMAGRIPIAMLGLVVLMVIGALIYGGAIRLQWDGEPERVAQVPARIGDYQGTCDGDRIYTAAPSYAGAGEHPIVVFQPASYDAPRGRSGRDPEFPVFASRLGAVTTPDGTTLPGFPVNFLLSEQLRRNIERTQQLGLKWWISPAPDEVQLVACAERTDVGDQVGACNYPRTEPVSFPLHRATFEVVLYEARTREEVTRITLEGGGHYCPTLFPYYRSQGARIFTTPTADQYVDAFRTFVEGRATAKSGAPNRSMFRWPTRRLPVA